MVTSDQRRRQLAREKYERQQERRAAARQKSRRRAAVIGAAVAVVAATLVGLVVGGVFDSDKKDAVADPAATPSSSPTPQQSPSPAMAIDAKAKYAFDLKTSAGAITFEMDAAKTPQTVNSFKSLADKGYFDNTKCHRLTTSGIFVLQCGDPQGTGMGGPGYTIPDENLESLGKANEQGQVVYPAGTVAMANTGQPGSGGSQFFLVYKDSPLAPSYTPFGKIDAAGVKVLEEVAKAGTADGGQDGAPKTEVKIEKGTVTRK
ncbi:peptidylprolyl isomerase [Streptomyces subrutilus]|uniref:Peptidyl-prolyl cis-trans isomerase n=1 Tax=Streptomyces subrutilus TaxID=36818 RepID=A0A5P2UQ82_9ACTN|nr:peptidylprolyl isomerase [Streptomyces subrutilus]QEU81452.1 peptidylprolyl isomerase [Streptomyces subrutilus]WSJ29210.1 peptidylprolyl isomerase [Streptomyces subrutilus]GGZ94663.1 peptidyl-prolyl cis-trans isomerase [Streptomyces subrutilus]